MNSFFKRTWAEIDYDRAKENFLALKDILRPGVLAISVVKADAYGHGAVGYARLLAELGTDWFAVSNLEEALQLREAGLQQPILILGYTPAEHAQTLAFNMISQAVYDYDSAKALSDAADAAGVQISIHVKVDTGMSRLGFHYQDNVRDTASIDAIEAAVKLPGLYPQGIFTHFAVADEAEQGEAYTRLQYDLFLDAIRHLEARGIGFELKHCCNSAASCDYPEMQLDACRFGISLYGLKSSAQVRGQDMIKPVMAVKSVIAMVKEIEAGTSVSYGRTFTAEKPMRVATIPIGYADGYPRPLSGKGARMLVHGQYAPLLGRICMDMCIIDITDIPDAGPGDIVTVIGEDGDHAVTADEIAGLTGTIHYEITCDISKRVPRVGKKTSC